MALAQVGLLALFCDRPRFALCTCLKFPSPLFGSAQLNYLVQPHSIALSSIRVPCPGGSTGSKASQILTFDATDRAALQEIMAKFLDEEVDGGARPCPLPVFVVVFANLVRCSVM